MINKEIYTLTQEELILYITNILDERGIHYNTHKGNIYGLNHQNKVCFVSHMDTVADTSSEMKKPVYEVNGYLFKNNAVLGADDRAGVNMILNYIDDVNFIFTVDEEIGCLGARDLAGNYDFLKKIDEVGIVGFIELDRKGSHDILGSSHGYCDVDFHLELQRVLGEDSVDAIGAFTDIDQFQDLAPCCNLSVGYYDQHSDREYLNIEEWRRVNSLIPELNKIQGEFKITPKSIYSHKSSYSSLYKDYMHGYEEAVNCSNHYDNPYCTMYLSTEEYDSIDDDYEMAKQCGNEIAKLTTDGDYLDLTRCSEFPQLSCSCCGEKIMFGQEYSCIYGSVYCSECSEEMKEYADE